MSRGSVERGTVAQADRRFAEWRRSGDVDALAEVYDRTAGALLRIAMHQVREPAMAEDLVQATFVVAIERAHGYDATRPLLAWLVGILHNQAKWLRRRQRQRPDPARVGSAPVADPADAAARAEFSAQVDDAIQTLPAMYQPVLRLHLRYQLDAVEIAHALGRPAGTVRSQVARGLQQLRAVLPAGAALAGTLLLLPSRGLAAMRVAVLAHGAGVRGAAAAASTTLAATTGVALMKKFGMFAALLAIAWALWLSVRNGAGRPAADGAVPASARATSALAQVPPAHPAAPVAAEPERQLVVAALPTWRVVGRITQQGAPVAAAHADALLQWGYGSERIAAAVGDANGAYVVDLADLRAWAALDLDRVERLTVSVWTTGGATAAADVVLPHRDPSRSLELRQDLALEPACIVLARIVDDVGRPVADAGLFASRGAEDAGHAKSDADGAIRLGLRVEGPVDLHVAHDRRGSCDARVAARRGELQDVGDLVLRGSAMLRFRAVFESGLPAAGIELLVGDFSSRADEAGRFVVARPAPGSYEVRAASMGLRDDRVGTVVTDRPEQDLVLHGLHLVVPRFEDEAGRVLRPFTVHWRRYAAADDAALAEFANGGALPDLDGAGRGSGSFEQLLLASGDWLWISARHGDACGEVLVHAMPPTDVLRPTIRMLERRRDASLRLDLQGDDGGPVGELRVSLAQVRLGEPGQSFVSTKASDPSGALVWSCTPGRFRLEAAPMFRGPPIAQGWLRPFVRVVDLHAGAETLVADTLPVGGRVRFRVRAPGAGADADVADLAIDSAAVADLPAGWRATFIRQHADGWSETSTVPVDTPMLWKAPLPPGRNVLTIRSRDFADQDLCVEIRRREVTDVDVWLQPR